MLELKQKKCSYRVKRVRKVDMFFEKQRKENHNRSAQHLYSKDLHHFTLKLEHQSLTLIQMVT